MPDGEASGVGVAKDEWMYEQDDKYDRILGQTTAVLAQRGDDQAVALLVDVQSMYIMDTDEVIRTEQFYDHWTEQPATHTTVRRTAVFEVPDHIVDTLTDDLAGRILPTFTYVAERNGERDVLYLRAQPALPDVGGDWRTAYAADLNRERPTNQARRERGDGAYPVDDGLAFGSTQEHRVYEALKRLQSRFPEERTIAIAPLPGVRLRAGHTWSPDVMVVGRGRALVVEVDGPHHRSMRRYVDDRNRDLQWQRCGVPVVRIAVEDLVDDDALEARLLEEIRRHLNPQTP
jgi:hypothetical protein